MTIPDYILTHLISARDFQVNVEYDANGNEVYWGAAVNIAEDTDSSWIILKNVYTATSVGGSTVYLLTHTSFLRNQVWANRASITFP